MSRVSRLCPIFRAQPGAYPLGAKKRMLRRRAGALRKWQTQKKNAYGQTLAEGEAASGEAAGYGFVKG